jgi:3-hydroxy-3-methylglutaryl CoA synthase
VATPIKTGIKSFGAYLPARRMSRAAIAEAHAWAFPALKSLGKGERTLCSWDEDVITMAVEAGRDCLRGMGRDNVSSFSLASTTAPYADLQNSVISGYALGLPAEATCIDVGSSTKAGIVALGRACRAGDPGDRIVVAADKRTAKPGSAQECQYGDGAGAILIGEGAGLIARFLGSETLSVPFIDHFRHEGEKFDYFWEERWVRDEGVAKIVPRTITALLNRIGVSAERVKHFGLAGGPIGSDRFVAKILGINAENVLSDLQGRVGDCGTAQPLLLLIQALELAQPGEVIVVGSFAQGCEVLAFERLSHVPGSSRRGLGAYLTRRIEETSYMKMLSFEGHVQLDWGMRAESDQKTALTQFYRAADQILGFRGGRCGVCETVQFPRLPACVNCGAVDSQTPVSLMDEPAKVATYTADWLQYCPSPPLYVGLVQFDVGARLLMEMTDVGGRGIDIGTPLEMRLRIKEHDKIRNYDRYFWKAVPLDVA